MAFTNDDLDRLEAAISTGTLRVRYRDGRETQFRSLQEMLTTRTLMQAELGISKVRRPVMLSERLR
jgi:hypothetical protein